MPIDYNYFKYIFIIESHGQKIICKIHNLEIYIETCEIHLDELIRCVTIDFNFKNIHTSIIKFLIRIEICIFNMESIWREIKENILRYEVYKRLIIILQNSIIIHLYIF